MNPGHKLGARVTVLLLPFVLLAQAAMGQPSNIHEKENDELLQRIWSCVQGAQEQVSTGCGRVTETRTSSFLERPMVLRGKFCAEGTTKFDLQYHEPHPLRVTFNEDYLNVSIGAEVRSTDVFEVGHHVRRTQGYFSREHSIDNIKDSFVVLAQESKTHYEMKLKPRTKRFEKRVNHIVVQLDKEKCILRSLEVDGRNGVNSLFKIEITELNTTLSEETFRVYRPK